LAAPHLPLDRQHREMPDECIDMEEKDPDIIPTNKGNFTFIFISNTVKSRILTRVIN
jgi:hypothetical protein